MRREVESGGYYFEAEVRIESLPNARGFVKFPQTGRLTHGMDGFRLTGTYAGEAFVIDWPVKTLYSCHVEYDYKKRGDCIDLNTNDDTFYLFPPGSDFSVTKIALATEELYKLYG